MTWSYSGDPATSDLDRVRFIVGDTIADDPILQDGEINAVLAECNNINTAAAKCCSAIVAVFARRCDRRLGAGLGLLASQQYNHYSALYTRLQYVASASSAPFSGGLLDEGTNNPKLPIFSRDMMTEE